MGDRVRLRVHRGGFTLIELLVVIAIIGILASMLMPVFAQAREKARQAVCSSNMRQLDLALAMYIQDYDGSYPGQDHLWIDNCPPCSFWMDVDYGVPDWFTSPYANWAHAIFPYVKEKGIYECKSTHGWTPNSNTRMPGLSYIYNGFAASRSEAGVPEPSRYVLLWDYRYSTSYAVANPVPSGWAWYEGWASHPSMYNVAYFDGHVKAVPESRFGADMRGLVTGNPFSF